MQFRIHSKQNKLNYSTGALHWDNSTYLGPCRSAVLVCFPQHLVSFITKDNQWIFSLVYFLYAGFSKEEVSEFLVKCILEGNQIPLLILKVFT